MRHLHSRNVAHRDLKSENVLVCDNNECKISDFGLSKESTGTTVSTGSNQVIGYDWYIQLERPRTLYQKELKNRYLDGR